VRALARERELSGRVEDLLGDLRAVGATGAPWFDADYMAAAMAGAELEIAVRMLERKPPEVEGAAGLATALLLGGVERLGAAGSNGRG